MERLTYWNEEYRCWMYQCTSGDAAKRLADLENALETRELLWKREEKKAKTYAVDFYEKFPEARASRFLFYPYQVYGSSTKCDGCNSNCPITICWNRPMESDK